MGSALKVVAGTPDARDLESIRLTEAMLTESNNRQIVVNSKIQAQINSLTDTVNKLLSNSKQSNLENLFEILAVNVSGTQLVTFDNFAMVNDTSFRNRNNAQRRLPGVASVPQLHITGYDTILSLPFLHQLSVDNSAWD